VKVEQDLPTDHRDNVDKAFQSDFSIGVKRKKITFKIPKGQHECFKHAFHRFMMILVTSRYQGLDTATLMAPQAYRFEDAEGDEDEDEALSSARPSPQQTDFRSCALLLLHSLVHT